MKLRIQQLVSWANEAAPKATWIERLLTRCFKCALFDGGRRCPYMYRWTVFYQKKIGGIFVHKFIADDWSKDLHDHSSRFVSIGLSGSYREWSTDTGTMLSRIYSAPWVRTFVAEHQHRLQLLTPVVWTLVMIGPKRRASGFWVNGKWTRADDYLVSLRANHRKSCGDGPS